jgi:pimeloyl-ACP methyl ester carboxylesterase
MIPTVMLIHGAWLNAASWAGFKARYESKGHAVLAPDWPYDDRPPAELRASPRPELARVGQKDLFDHYERLIRALPEPPILIGHSLGGVIVQHLLDRGLGVAGVAINPAPTPGVPLGPHAVVSALPVFSDLLSWRKAKVMSRKFFAERFAQTAPRDRVDELYDRYIVPTPGKVYWDGVTGASGRIDWKNPNRAPLLLIGGEDDLIADASMTRAIFAKQRRAPSRTELKVFEGRSHWTCLDPGWEAVADYALDWALERVRERRPAAAVSTPAPSPEPEPTPGSSLGPSLGPTPEPA